jgi:hypothetical protein
VIGNIGLGKKLDQSVHVESGGVVKLGTRNDAEQKCDIAWNNERGRA